MVIFDTKHRRAKRALKETGGFVGISSLFPFFAFKIIRFPCIQSRRILLDILLAVAIFYFTHFV